MVKPLSLVLTQQQKKMAAPVEERDIIEEREAVPEDEGIGKAWMMVYILLTTLLLLVAIFITLKLWTWWKYGSQLKKWDMHQLSIKPVVVGFFHPYCNAGGGGERVLWQSISALQKRYSFIKCVVYAGFETSLKGKQIVEKVQDQFAIPLYDDIQIVYLKRRRWVEPGCWPRFTIVGQTIGSMVLGFEALLKFAPNVFIDTTGYAFVVPLFCWLGGCRTVSYVHYPTVSQDMLDKVGGSESSYNNSERISRSRLLTNLKLVYYRFYAKLYGFAGRRNDVVMVNSTWTHSHIAKIWGSRRLYIVYPPCDTTSFLQLPIKRDTKKFGIVSIGQFRPEKDHKLQLRILQAFLDNIADNEERERVELVLIGSCRNNDDMARVKELRQLANTLKIDRSVRFEINVPFERVKKELGLASAALHTMWNEHFGIGLVECMAAGCVMIGHNSGGPQQDIVVDWKGQRTGLLAAAQGYYVQCLLEVFRMSEEERMRMVSSARESVRSKFSVDVFEASFLRATEHLFT